MPRLHLAEEHDPTRIVRVLLVSHPLARPEDAIREDVLRLRHIAPPL
ncbi:hypothetical protein [Archangium violaceum]|nr:hypothetical protein [Archangium violaceum]